MLINQCSPKTHVTKFSKCGMALRATTASEPHKRASHTGGLIGHTYIIKPIIPSQSLRKSGQFLYNPSNLKP